MLPNSLLLLLILLPACSVQKSSLHKATPVDISCYAKVSRPQNDAVHVIFNVGSGQVLDILQAGSDPGTPLIQWPYLDGSHQHFILHDQGNGYDTIKAKHSGLFLDVQNMSTDEGAAIMQWSANGQENQNWQFASTGNGQYRIVSQHTRQVLSVDGESKAGAARIVQKADGGSPFQRWMIVAVDQLQSANCSPNADGFATGTTGGGETPATVVNTCEDLIKGLESSNRSVLTLDRAIDCRTASVAQAACAIDCGTSDPGKFSYRIPVPGQTCQDLGNATNDTVMKTRNERRIRVKSNKTILGLNDAAKILGATLDMTDSMNIIVRNLAIEDINPGLVEGGDGITLANSRQIWIDHVRFAMISDGYVDIGNSRNITLSWNHFVGKNAAICGNQHHYTHLVQDSQVTFHHNFWDTASGRNPKLLGPRARVHLYNNLWRDITYFAVNVHDGAEAKIEGNVFDNASRPHWNQDGSGFIEADPNSNRYLGRSATAKESKDNTGKVFADQGLYPYTLDSLDHVQQSLRTAVGPQL